VIQPGVRFRSEYMMPGGSTLPNRHDPGPGPCEWGGCENWAPDYLRLSPGQGWLPVCEACASKPFEIDTSGTAAKHDYVSTACYHANRGDGRPLHAECRRECKWCSAPCRCRCHVVVDPMNGLPGPTA
jgi:hypothetical protein